MYKNALQHSRSLACCELVSCTEPQSMAKHTRVGAAKSLHGMAIAEACVLPHQPLRV